MVVQVSMWDRVVVVRLCASNLGRWLTAFASACLWGDVQRRYDYNVIVVFVVTS